MHGKETVLTKEGKLPHTLPEETCEWCDDGVATLGVYCSAAGFYIGYRLSCCGVPISRESGYYKTRTEAERALLQPINNWRR